MARSDYLAMSGALTRLRAEKFGEAQSEIVALQDALEARSRMAPNPWRIVKLESAISRLSSIDPPVSAVPEAPPQVDFFRGNALFRLNRVEEAAAAWEACVRRSPALAEAWNNLAVAYWSLRRMDEALRILDRAESLGLKMNPDLRSDVEKTAARAAGGRG